MFRKLFFYNVGEHYSNTSIDATLRQHTLENQTECRPTTLSVQSFDTQADVGCRWLPFTSTHLHVTSWILNHCLFSIRTHSPLVLTFEWIRKDPCTTYDVDLRSPSCKAGALSIDGMRACIGSNLFQYIHKYFFTKILSMGFSSLCLPLIFTIHNLLKRLFVLSTMFILSLRKLYLGHIYRIFAFQLLSCILEEHTIVWTGKVAS